MATCSSKADFPFLSVKEKQQLEKMKAGCMMMPASKDELQGQDGQTTQPSTPHAIIQLLHARV